MAVDDDDVVEDDAVDDMNNEKYNFCQSIDTFLMAVCSVACSKATVAAVAHAANIAACALRTVLSEPLLLLLLAP